MGYPARRDFGRYIGERLAETMIATGGALAHWRVAATSIARHHGGYRIGLAGDAGHLDADVVIVATGHDKPRLPAGLQGAAGHPALVEDPHGAPSLAGIDRDGSVLILGSGLTMADTVVALRTNGHRGAVTVVSRRGLLPRERLGPPQSAGEFRAVAAAGPRAVLRAVRTEVGLQARQGRPWTDVLAAVREQNPSIWWAWNDRQKQAFLRHLKPYWDAHRFLLAPSVGERLRADLAAGRLSVSAGQIVNARPAGAAIAVAVRPRGAGRDVPSVRHFAAVINCTGAGRPDGPIVNPFIASAVSAGLARLDPFGLGIAADEEGRVISREGEVASDLLTLGPPARSGLGETTGVPEIAAHAAAMASRITDLARQRNGTINPMPKRQKVASAP